MNKIYKVVWSRAKHCYIVTSEIAKSVSKTSSASTKAKLTACVVASVLGLGLSASAADLSVNYDTSDKDQITLNGDATNGVKVTNVANGSVTSGSKDAVNGGQLYELKTKVTGFESTIDNINANVAENSSLLAEHTQEIGKVTTTANSALNLVKQGYDLMVNGTKVANYNPNNNSISYTNGTNTQIAYDKTTNALKVNVVGNGTMAAGDTGLISGDTLNTAMNAEATARKADDDAINAKLGTLTDGTYTRASGTFASNIAALDNQVKLNADNIAQEIKDRDAAISKMKDQITGSIDSLTDNAVKYTEGTNYGTVELKGKDGTKITRLAKGTLSADSTDAVNGSQLFAVDSKVTQEVADREAAITAEAKLREDADTAIKNTIGTIAGVNTSYINSTATVSQNLINLDAQVKNNADAIAKEATERATDVANAKKELSDKISALDGNSVQYTDATKASVKLGGAGGTKITNLAKGTLSADSTDAVNGSQLFAVDSKVTQEVNDRKAAITAEETARTNAIATEAKLREDADTAIKNTIGTIAANGEYIRKADSIADNLTALDTQVKKNADGLAQEIKDRDTAISKMKDQITGSIDSLTDNAVKYTEGTNYGTVELKGKDGTKITRLAKGTLSADSTDAVNGSQLFAVDTKVDQEIADRKAAITAEETARKAEDTAIKNTIGSIAKDGYYISSSGTVFGNLSNLDTQVKKNADDITAEAAKRAEEIKTVKTELTNTINNLDGNSVQYTDKDKGTVHLGGAGGTVINNVKAGTLSETSTEAVNGAQLNATNTNLTNEINARIKAIDDEVTARNTAIASEAKARDDADTAIKNTIGTLGANGEYIRKADSVADNLTALDTQVKKNADAITTEATTRANEIAAVKNELNNKFTSLNGNAVQYTDDTKATVKLGGAGGTKITNLAKGTLSADSTDAVNGSQLFAVDSKVTQEVSDRKAAITAEETARTNAIAAEAKLREDADTAIKNTIGTIAANGEYIRKADSIADNLTALDTQVKKNADGLAQEIKDRDTAISKMKDQITGSIDSLTDNAVKYTEGTNYGTVELKGRDGTKITRLAKGDLSATSTDAINGSQLFETNTNLDKEIQDRKDAITAEETARTNAIAAEAKTREDADTAIKNSIGTIADNGAYINKGNTVADNLKALDTQVKKNADGLSDEIKARQDAITDVKNQLSDSVKNLNDNTVKYTDGTYGTVELKGRDGTKITRLAKGDLSATSTDAVNGSQLFETNTNLDKEIQDRKDAITSEAQARKDATDALEKSLTTTINNLSGNAVQYTDATKTLVKLGGDGGTTISNVKAGTLSDTSTEAINGAQLFDTNTKVTRNRNNITTLQNNFTELSDDVAANRAKLTSLTNSVTSMTSSVTKVIKSLNEAQKNFADISLSNITEDGSTVISNIAKQEINKYMQAQQAAATQQSANTNDIATLAAPTNGTPAVVSDVATFAATAGGNVTYDQSGIGTITLAESGTQIKNVADGTVAANSKDAVNGGQLYNVQRQVNQLDVQSDGIRSNISEIQAVLASQTNDVGNLTTTTNILKRNQDTGFYVNINNKRVKNITPSDVDLNLKNGTYSTITADEKGNITFDVKADGKAELGNSGLMTGDKVYAAVADKANTDLSNITDAAKNSIRDAMSSDLSGKANVDMDNLSTDGINKIKDLSKTSVKVVDGNGTTVSSSYDEKGNVSYAVNIATGDISTGGKGFVTADTVKAALDTKANIDLDNLSEAGLAKIKSTMSADLATKASVDASNINAGKYAEKLGTGVVTSGDTSLVTGGTVYEAIKNLSGGTGGLITKVDVDMGNVSDEGKTVIKDLAKEAVKVADGQYTTVSNETDTNGNTTYHVNVTADGVIEAGNNGLITGDTAKKALDTKANIDFSNISDAGIQKVKDIMSADMNLKADTSLSNITSEGATKIKNLAQGSVKVIDGNGTTVSSSYDEKGNVSYAVNIATGDLNQGGTGFVTADAVKYALSKKANRDASNIDADKYAEKLGTGTVTDGDTSLVTGSTVYNAIKNLSGGSGDLITKINVDMDNISSAGKTVIKNLAKDAVKVADGKYTTVTNETDKDGNITYHVNVTADGVIEDGNTGLITGETAKKALDAKANTDLSNISDAGKNVIKDTMKADLDKKADKDYVDNALAGKVDKSDFDAVKNQVDKNTADIANKADKSYVDDALSKKADADKVYTKEETDAKIDSKIDSVKDSLAGDLENKVNKDASNIEKDKWQEALGDGVNEAGNKGLINGDTLHTALDDLKKEGASLIRQDGDTIKVASDSDATKVDFKGKDKDGNSIDRVLTGIKTDADDMSSAANVGYVQEVSAGLESEMNYMNNKLSNDIREAGAVASALAGLHHIDYDPDNKLDFAVATAGYRGKSAAALGAFYQPNENVMFSLAGTIGSSHNAWNAGVSFKIGQGGDSPVLSRRVLGNRVNALAAQNQALAERNEQLEQAVRDMQDKLDQILATMDVNAPVQKTIVQK